MKLYIVLKYITIIIQLTSFQFKSLNDLIDKVEGDLMKIRDAAE